MGPTRALPASAAVLLLAAAPLAAEDSAPPDPAAALAPFVHVVEVADGRLAGPGGELLRRAAERAHFLLFGEQHATAEIAEIATALYRTIAPLGYDHAAIEVGPVGAERLESLLRDEDAGALERYFATGTNLFSIPFYFFVEEAEFARSVVAGSPAAAPVLWGLDQEFVAGAGPVLDRLAELAATAAEREAVAAARAAAAANPMFLGTAPAGEIEALARPFAAAAHPAARDLAAQVVASNRIYAPFTGRGGSAYAANREREDLMKTLFLRRYRPVRERDGRVPRVLVKLGANHLFRGLSPTHVLSLGTFLVDLAAAEGVEAYNLHVDCRGGEATDVMTGAPAPCASYFLAAESVLAAALPADRTVLVDLRALREEDDILAALDEASRDLVWSFDGYVAIPGTRAATLFAGERPDLGR